MKAMIYYEPGGTEVLQYLDVPDPEPGPGDVVIDVAATALNRLDVVQRHGWFQMPGFQYPHIAGMDVSGVVAAVGDEVSNVSVGDRVVVDPSLAGVAGNSKLAGRGDLFGELGIIGATADGGPILVTGATGGVGSIAVSMLAGNGYEVVASTGKADQAEWLRGLGASDVIGRDETSPEKVRPLDKERWQGVVDCVGGNTLAYALSSTRYDGCVAASGLTGGPGLSTTVMPFILRGGALAGIDSVSNPIEKRRAVWGRLASDLRPAGLDDVEHQLIGLDDLSEAIAKILAGGMVGRTLVQP